MNCNSGKECPAKSRPETPCWEIAGELNDYRAAMDICQDCVVYMLKAENSILSDKDIRSIMNHKAICVLS